ncbi:MAG: ATPase, T2SS/T4P/T4SS family [Kiritimatiellia bacterium]
MPRSKGRLRIEDILVEHNAISAEQLKEAVQATESSGTRLEKYLVDKEMVEPAAMTLAISEYLGMAPIALGHFTSGEELMELVPKEILARHWAVPVARAGKTLTVALGDPFDITAMDDLQMQSGLEIIPLVASEKDVIAALDRSFPEDEAGETVNMEELMQDADADLEISHEKVEEQDDENIDAVLEKTDQAPVVRMVSMILVEAMRKGASDIHFEPQEKDLSLRYRIDGSLVEMPSPPKGLQAAILSRMKLMSGMDISERRIPQDGRIKIKALGKEVDLRVNTLPTIFGEKVVMRLLDKSSLFPNLAALGLDDEAFKAMKRAVGAPNGIVLVTGPTGSGKTTTLYSCLMELNRPDVNIMTCEDPVEYQLPGINQVQINSFVGLTFAAALRSVLRQSPDIILVGEIRDSETAEIAIKAALTGHLVLSTLHTNDAAGAITRLTDMGVEPSLLAPSLVVAQAQRLIRKLCGSCRKKMKEVPGEMLKAYDIEPSFFEDATIYKAGGCAKCHGSGYKGRLAIMEVLPVDRDLRKDILDGSSTGQINEKAQKKGMLSLKEIGLRKVKEGITSLDAALRVTGGGE